jgi:hypothetical protein
MVQLMGGGFEIAFLAILYWLGSSGLIHLGRVVLKSLLACSSCFPPCQKKRR